MDEVKSTVRDVTKLVVPRVGRVEQGDQNVPVRLLGPAGVVVGEVTMFLADLQAAGRSGSTLRSYAMDLLRWYRFLWAVGVAWDRADRIEARDFCRWLAIVPVRGAKGLAPATRVHVESVVRGFYDLHNDLGSGPVLNPFPTERAARPGGHFRQAPGERGALVRRGRYRPRMPRRVPRSLPDDVFDRVFTALPSHRDRALVAFYVSSGARAAELLGACGRDVDPGAQSITVVRKGTRLQQQLPASPDAFVWLRLYQQEFRGRVPQGRSQPLWWTLRAPFRPLTYHGAHRMFTRAASSAGIDATLHMLRHTAAFRMAQDPEVPLCDVQWVLGHASLSTTQVYLSARPEDAIAAVLRHHQRRPDRPVPAPPAAGYRAESLETLFAGVMR